jgi:hypothetical protein
VCEKAIARLNKKSTQNWVDFFYFLKRIIIALFIYFALSAVHGTLLQSRLPVIVLFFLQPSKQPSTIGVPSLVH